MAAGIKFFMSTNNVVLTRGVAESGVLPMEFFSRAVRRLRSGAMAPLELAVGAAPGAAVDAAAAPSPASPSASTPVTGRRSVGSHSRGEAGVGVGVGAGRRALHRLLSTCPGALLWRCLSSVHPRASC